jgi:hypothetical protein
MEQQFWCMGCDARRKAGNLLLAYGFEVHPAPQDAADSCYTHGEGDRRLWLWRFGAAWSASGVLLYADREDARPRLIPADMGRTLHHVHQPEPLQTLTTSTRPRLIASLGTRFAAYERWVQETAGPLYRERCVASWRRPRVVDALAMADAWRAVGHEPADDLRSTGAPAGGVLATVG